LTIAHQCKVDPPELVNYPPISTDESNVDVVMRNS